MRPTRFGFKALLFYALLVCAFYAAPYLNLFFMLLAFASVLSVLSLYWTWHNIRGIHGCMREPAPCPAGCPTAASLDIDGHGRVRYGLHATIRIAGTEHLVCDHFDLAAPGPQQIGIQIPALPRGIHNIDGMRIGSIHPFGTAVAWRRIDTPAQLVIHPAPADLTRYRDRNGITGPGTLGGGLSDEMGPAGLREYRVGDELRNVHWKATARRQDLVIKDFEGEVSPGVEICLDLRCNTEELEESLSLIAGLALECQSNKELFTLHSQDHHGTYGKGHLGFTILLRHLAAATTLPSSDAAPPAVSPSVLRLPLRGSGRPQAKVVTT